MVDARSPLGIVAGNGIFPREIARNARAHGIKVVAALHRGEADAALADEVDDALWVKVGQLGAMIRFFRRAQVQDVVFAGGIRRVNLVGGVKLDWRGFTMLTKVRSRKDDALLRAIAGEFEIEGMRVIGAHQLLAESVAQAGILTHRNLTAQEAHDAEIGAIACRRSGDLDIGQAVVAFEGIVVAVEAVEGTDQMLRRSGELTARRGGVVVKLCKQHQDLRLDLPTIGEHTIRSMIEAGLTALVIEAGKTVLLTPVETIARANAAGIAIVAQ